MDRLGSPASAKGLDREREEYNSLPLTGSPNTTSGDFPVVGIRQGMPGSPCSIGNKLVLQGIDHSDIPSCVLPSRPVGEEDICWPSISPRKECSAFLGRGQGSTCTGVVQCVPEKIVS